MRTKAEILPIIGANADNRLLEVLVDIRDVLRAQATTDITELLLRVDLDEDKMAQTLRQAAMAAYEEHQQQQAELQAEQQRAEEARVRRDFKNDFDCEPTTVKGSVVTVDEGGLPLVFVGHESDSGFRYWTVVGRCHHCGEETDSQRIRDGRDLGEMLAQFRSCAGHQCLNSTPREIRPPSAAAAVLLEALREWRDSR